MKGKIIKAIMAVLLVCSISVPLSGCAFVNPDVRENFEDWADDFLGGIFGDADDGDKDDSTNSGNEDSGNGNENTGTENEGGSSTENTKFEGSGEMYVDDVNHISIRPTKTTVSVGETFSINVEKLTGCTITENATFTVLSTGVQGGLSIDVSGNITALKVGEGAVQVTIGEVNYLVNITVVSEATENTTYVLSCTYKYADKTITVNPLEVKMRVGDTFTMQATTTTTATPTRSLRAIEGNSKVEINGLTLKAMKTGTVEVILDFAEDDLPFKITVIIIEAQS